jgi:stalled ribosome alternative rescue factor ArfA
MMKTTAHKSAGAKALADRKYHQRIVMSKKGRGSYDRKRMEKKYA